MVKAGCGCSPDQLPIHVIISPRNTVALLSFRSGAARICPCSSERMAAQQGICWIARPLGEDEQIPILLTCFRCPALICLLSLRYRFVIPNGVGNLLF
jgi:hypothetical protein